MMPIILLKAHVKPHTRRDGVFVHGYERHDGGKHGKTLLGKKKLFGPAPLPKSAVPHPEVDDHGEKVMIHHPSEPTPPQTWFDPKAVATFVPGGEVPVELNGVPIAPWTDHPTTDEGWDYVDGVDDDLDEPPFHVATGKAAASGVVIEEPDGRVWLVAPTNSFGGYRASFPKGNAEPDLSLQANAIKEVFEETGLKVKITGFLGDYTRTTTVARLYRGVRVGGTPAAMGWESQAVHLAPKDALYGFLNRQTDHGIAQAIGAGEPPPVPKIKLKDDDSADLFDF